LRCSSQPSSSYALRALNDREELIKVERRMAEFPLDPMVAKAVSVSEKYGMNFARGGGDHMALLRCYTE